MVLVVQGAPILLTGFEIRASAVWGRARYLSVTEAPHNTEFLRVSRKETFCFLKTWRPEWGSNPRSPNFQAGSFNHCIREYRSTRTHVNWYPCQLVPMSARTTIRCQLVPQNWCQLVPPLDVRSYSTRQVSDIGTSWHLLPHNLCQLVPMSTRTHGNSYHY